MRGVLAVFLMSVAMICTSAASASDRIEVDLTYEPANPLETKCQQADPAGPNYDPVYRPPMRFPVDFCGITSREWERSRCEAMVTVHFGKDRRVPKSSVELKSGRASCKEVLEGWVPRWQLCPDAPESAYHLKMSMTLCGRPKAPDKPIEAAKPETPPEPSSPNAVSSALGRIFKSVAQTYAPVFGSDCESADGD